jgi:hypothetical protein
MPPLIMPLPPQIFHAFHKDMIRRSFRSLLALGLPLLPLHDTYFAINEVLVFVLVQWIIYSGSHLAGHCIKQIANKPLVQKVGLFGLLLIVAASVDTMRTVRYTCTPRNHDHNLKKIRMTSFRRRTHLVVDMFLRTHLVVDMFPSAASRNQGLNLQWKADVDAGKVDFVTLHGFEREDTRDFFCFEKTMPVGIQNPEDNACVIKCKDQRCSWAIQTCAVYSYVCNTITFDCNRANLKVLHYHSST